MIGAELRTPRFRDALSHLSSAQKPDAGVPAYTRWVNRGLGRVVAALAAAVGLGANAVTLISAVVSVAGLVVIVAAPREIWAGVVAGPLLALGYVLDSADGQVSRLTRTSSPAGEWLDHVVDAMRTPMLHMAVAVALLWHGSGQQFSYIPYLSLAFAVVVVGQFMSQVLAKQLSARFGVESTSPASGGYGQSILLLPIDMGVMCWMFVLWGFPIAFGIVYTVVFVITLIHSGVSMTRKYRKLVKLKP